MEYLDCDKKVVATLINELRKKIKDLENENSELEKKISELEEKNITLNKIIENNKI